MKTNPFPRVLTVLLALALLPFSAPAVPVVQHSPVPTAEQGHPFGLRAAVRDATARIESVTLFYSSSRSATPFRAPMSSSGAGLWYGSIPGHLVGPGTELFYYIQAENADGETADTPWYTVRVVPPSDSPSAASIPSASAVAAQAQSSSVPPAAQATRRVQDQRAGSAAAQAAKDRSDNSKKYWIAAGVIAGGAVAVGGAIALSDSSSGGGSGSSSSGSGTVTNGNFGGNYTITFTPATTTTTDPPSSPSSSSSVAPASSASTSDSGLVNFYVKGSSVEIVGLWGSEVLQGTLSGNMFSAAANVSARAPFPAAYLTVSGQFSGDSCHATVNGTSTDFSTPGIFSGSANATRR